MPNSDLFTISQVAKLFGDVSTSWIREKEARGLFRDKSGKVIEAPRTKDSQYKSYGARRYNLKTLYEMAISLEKSGAITWQHRDAILDVLVALKRVRKYPKKKE